MSNTKRREPKRFVIELHPDGRMMYVLLENWRPVAISAAIDPEARTFAEGVRQLVVKLMRRKLRVPV